MGFYGIIPGENDFITSSTVNFPKERTDFGDLKANQRHELQARFFHASFYI